MVMLLNNYLRKRSQDSLCSVPEIQMGSNSFFIVSQMTGRGEVEDLHVLHGSQECAVLMSVPGPLCAPRVSFGSFLFPWEPNQDTRASL